VSSSTDEAVLDLLTRVALALAWKPGGAEDDVIVKNSDGKLSLIDRLHGVPWFAACTEEQLEAVVRLAERLHIDAGEVILREGRLGRELFVILEGSVVVTRAGRVVNEWGVGDYFGELAAIEGVPRTATVTAITDLDVLIVGPREFDAMMDIPGVRNALFAGMARRIREGDDMLDVYAEDEAGADRRPE
jgi:signal-transduction protein with cAMP-binding, CBS, and nucleotidyltransferase domain